MSDKVTANVVLENTRIIFRNFAGLERKFNPAGERNFAVVVEDLELAKRLKKDGWNIKYFPEAEEGDIPNAYMKVKVKFGNNPPKIILVTKRGETRLTEDTIDALDYADIVNVDLIVRPYNWEVNNKIGVTAYVQDMWVVVQEDKFTEKYSDGAYFDEVSEEV